MTSGTGYVLGVLRQWPVLLVGLLLGTLGGAAYTAVATPVYTSSSTVLVALASSGSTADRLQGSTYLQQTIPTFSDAVTSSTVLVPVIRSLGLDSTLAELRDDVSVTTSTDTALIQISAQAETSRDARRLADAITDRFVSVAPGLISPVTTIPTPTPSTDGSQSNGVPATLSLSVVDSPLAPERPDSPSLPLGLALGALAGLLVGIVVALVRLVVDSRVRDLDTVERIIGAPVIGVLPDLGARGWGARSGDRAWTLAVNEIRSVLFAPGDRLRTVQFTASSRGEGVTSTLAAIAGSLARSGRRVTVIDADFTEPASTGLREAGTASRIGLIDLLRSPGPESGTQGLDAATGHFVLVPADTGDARTDVATAGDLLASDRLPHVLETLRDDTDVLLVDSPAVDSSADALSIARWIPTVILVVALGRVTEPLLTATVDRLRGTGATVSGVVVTRAPRSTRLGSTGRALHR